MGFRLDSMPVLVGGRGGEGRGETERRLGKERGRREREREIGATEAGDHCLMCTSSHHPPKFTR